MNFAIRPAALAWLIAMPAAAFGQSAHVHGIAKLEVVAEGRDLLLHLESPLDGVLGFEHAPRNDREDAAVAQMRRTLVQGDTLFAPTPAAQCRLVSASVTAPSLDAKPAGGHAEHSDLDADFRFTCAQPGKLNGLEVRLGDAFPRLRRIDAEVVSGKGQSATKLSSKQRWLSW